MTEDQRGGAGGDDAAEEQAAEAARTARRDQEVVFRFPLPGRVLPKSLLDLFLPEDAARHVRAAQRESLLAVRSMIDSALESIDDRDHDQPSSRRIDIAVE